MLETDEDWEIRILDVWDVGVLVVLADKIAENVLRI